MLPWSAGRPAVSAQPRAKVARPEPLTLRGTVVPTIARTLLCSAAIRCGARRFSGVRGVAATDTTVASAKAIKTYVDANITAQDLDITDGSSTIAIDLDSETLSLLGGTGVTSTASGNGVTFAIGQSQSLMLSRKTPRQTATAALPSACSLPITLTRTLVLPTSSLLLGRWVQGKVAR